MGLSVLIFGSQGYDKAINERLTQIRYNPVSFNDVKGFDLALFTGGEDVSPWYYKADMHPKTQNNPMRDAYEANAYSKLKKLGIPCVGICRGGQFLNVMNGGQMFQHVNGHAGSNHEVVTVDGEVFEVTSTHHQMMVPAKHGSLYAWSHENLSDVYEGLNLEAYEHGGKVVEPEAILYTDTNDLCVQWHPEYMSTKSRGYEYFNELLELIV